MSEQPVTTNALRWHGRLVGCLAAATILTAAGCRRADGGFGRGAIDFPDDASIAAALQADFARDAANARAQELVKMLGGDKGRLEFRVQRVIARAGVVEAGYDVALKMDRPGVESLAQVLRSLIPADEAAKLGEQNLAAYERWLTAWATSAEKTQPQQAAQLRATVTALSACYRAAKPGDTVVLMQGLAAQLLPERGGGWWAEKAPSSSASARCLPL